MANTPGISRRKAIEIGAGAAALPLVHIRTAGAAGTLTGIVWSHWVPGYADAFRQLVDEWAERTKTAVRIDFVSNVAQELSEAEEAQARTGHDFRSFIGTSLKMHTYAAQLEPADDLIQLLSAKYGVLAPILEYMGKVEGSWLGVPGGHPTTDDPSCTRIDLFKRQLGMDVQAVFPVSSEMGPGYDQWTWDTFLVAAEKCAKTGFPFGLPMGMTSDATCWVAALFRGFGAELVDAKGNVTAKSDNVRQVLEYARRLMPFLPPDVYSWDDASNNRALISGKSALIFNPPSAWAGAVHDNPSVGEQIWHYPMPAGAHGRFVPFLCSFWGVWKFSRNKLAAKELILWLAQREQVERLCIASRGNELPVFTSMTDFPIWADIGPPKGTLFNYPIKPQHHAQRSVVGWPAPPGIATQIASEAVMPKMIGRVTQRGMSIDQSIALAEQELEGFMR
jgi:ABC-type glycerol-3-phosphate transport system substrate-binding protein